MTETPPFQSAPTMSKRHPATPDPPASPQETAARGRRLLAENRFKEAVALLKGQQEKQPGQPWNDLLGQAWLGRARELADHGLYKEALLLWDNADALLDEAPEPHTRLSWLFNARRHGEAVRLFNDLEKSLRRDHPRLLETIRVLIAALLLAGYSEVREALPDGSPLHGQKKIARDALDAVLGGTADAEARIAAISNRSPFRQLRWILESLTTPRDDPKRVLNLLKKIPPGSPFTRLAELSRIRLLDGPELAAGLMALPNPDRWMAARLAGVSAARLELLEQWTENAEIGSGALLDHLLKPIAKRFDARLEPLVRRHALAMLPDHTDRQERFTNRFGPLVGFEKQRLAALDQESRGNMPVARAYWHKCLQLLETQKNKADTDLKIGQIHLRLAHLERHRNHPDGATIRAHLENCLLHDPEEYEAALWLIERLGEDGESETRQQWINLTLERFPKRTEILGIALETARDRGAHKRASGLARRILRLDPGNDAVRNIRIDSHLAHARKQLLDRRPDLAARELFKAGQSEWHGPPHAAIPLLQGLCALLGHAAKAERAFFRQARQLFDNDILFILHLLLECHRLNVHRSHPERVAAFREELRQWCQTPVDGPAAVLTLIERLAPHLRSDGQWVVEVLPLLEPWLLQGVALPFDDEQFGRLCRFFQDTRQFTLENRYGEAAQRRFPDDPRFLFHRLHGSSRGRITHIPQRDLPELRTAAQTARERGDTGTADEIDRFIAPRSDGPDLPSGLDAPSLLSKSQATRLVRELSRQLLEDFGDIRPTLGDKGLKTVLLQQLQETEFAAFGPFVLGHLIDRALARTAPSTNDGKNKKPPPQQLELDLFP